MVVLLTCLWSLFLTKWRRDQSTTAMEHPAGALASPNATQGILCRANTSAPRLCGRAIRSAPVCLKIKPVGSHGQACRARSLPPYPTLTCRVVHRLLVAAPAARAVLLATCCRENCYASGAAGAVPLRAMVSEP